MGGYIEQAKVKSEHGRRVLNNRGTLGEAGKSES